MTTGERFANNVKARRLELQMTQADLARLVGKGRVSVHNWESQGVFPPGDTLDAIAKALQVDLGWLLTSRNEYAEPEGFVASCRLCHQVEPIDLYLDTWKETPESEPGKRLWKMEKLSRCKKCGLLFLPLTEDIVDAMERGRE